MICSLVRWLVLAELACVVQCTVFSFTSSVCAGVEELDCCWCMSRLCVLVRQSVRLGGMVSSVTAVRQSSQSVKSSVAVAVAVQAVSAR